ncbi:helix-turn-helix domain-containing protein [Streptomyces sp. bgisy034]|uniref:helix-turn-helix domain-containing protein n=1 Tax=Streptomyces sp. bgisy034 TaxID=3413774 RepID=UPI003EBB9CD6
MGPREPYGKRLKRMRERAGLTQQELGERMFASAQQVAHWENGRRAPSLEDARRLDRFLDADGVFEEFLPGLSDKRYAEHFAEAARWEKEAVQIKEYSPVLVPGILQTPEYAEAVFRAYLANPEPEEVVKRVASRMERARIMDSRDLEMWSLLHESVLRIRVGDDMVMALQMRRVGELARAGRIRLHIIPFAAGPHPLMQGMVSLMRFRDAPPLAYVEGVRTGFLRDDPETVRKYQQMYELALSEALSTKDSLALLKSAAEEYES